MRALFIALLALGAVGGDRHGLDLPVCVSQEQVTEDAPSLIEFYQAIYEADSVVFVVDASGSMRERGEWEIAKREVLRSLEDYRTSEVGCVVYSAVPRSFPERGPLLRPGRGSRAALSGFLARHRAEGRTCPHSALRAALGLAGRGAGRRAVIFLTDGGGSCNGISAGSSEEVDYLRMTLIAATGENTKIQADIHSVGVHELGENADRFLRQLAARNGGTYRRISR